MIIRNNLQVQYSDIYTPKALSALEFMSVFNADVKTAMKERIQRRSLRIRDKTHLDFLDPQSLIPGTDMKVQDARDGKFEGSEIPEDLKRQWIQGTGPAAKPNAPIESSLRNVSYALLSGADGWMFDGEDALGQITTMSLDNQRSLKLAIRRDPLFLTVAEQVSREMNKWSQGFFGKDIVMTGENNWNLRPLFSEPGGFTWTTGISNWKMARPWLPPLQI